jgi:predicted Rossmann-fold nucleotide-binding protein
VEGAMVGRSLGLMETLEARALEIRARHASPIIGVIGAAMPEAPYARRLGEYLGGLMSVYLQLKGTLFTGGVPGVGEDVFNGFKAGPFYDPKLKKFFALLPEGFPPLVYGDQADVEIFGEDMYQRRIGMGLVADALIVLHGGSGTLHEAAEALKRGKHLVVFQAGGAGSELYLAKTTGTIPTPLKQAGIEPDHLSQIHPAGINTFRDQLDEALVGSRGLSLGAGIPERVFRMISREDSGFMEALAEAAGDKTAHYLDALRGYFAMPGENALQVISCKGLRELADLRTKGLGTGDDVIGMNLRKDAPLLVVLESGDEAGALKDLSDRLGFPKNRLFSVVIQDGLITENQILNQLRAAAESRPGLGRAYGRQFKVFAGRDGRFNRLFTLLSKRPPESWKGFVEIDPLDVLEELITGLLNAERMAQAIRVAA